MAAAPPLRDRGHRTGGDEARAAAAASSSRAVTSTGPRTEETAAGWKGNSTGTKSRRTRRGGSGRGKGGGEPTGPFLASPLRKLTVAAATAAAADRNLSPAPRRGHCAGAEGAPRSREERGRPAEGGEARGGTASTRASLPAAAARVAVLQPGKGPAGREGGRKAGRCPRLGPQGRKRYLHRPGDGDPEAARAAQS